ncbi:MAG: hypothetical protein ACOY46_00215 [Bacillota bacterium]
MTEFADLIKNENYGVAELVVEGGSPALDREVKEVPILYNLVGESRFRVVRNNKFELVFVHLTEEWMRQAKVNLKGIDISKGLEVKLTWDEKEDTLSVRGLGGEYITSAAVQIDN